MAAASSSLLPAMIHTSSFEATDASRTDYFAHNQSCNTVNFGFKSTVAATGSNQGSSTDHLRKGSLAAIRTASVIFAQNSNSYHFASYYCPENYDMAIGMTSSTDCVIVASIID